MTIGQFIILTILYLIGIWCLVHNLCRQVSQKNITKMGFLLQIGATISMTILYGLGVIGGFCGIYNA